MFISKLERVGCPHKRKKIREALGLTCTFISKQKFIYLNDLSNVNNQRND